MGKPFIVVGDQLAHGGAVVEGTPTTTTGGKMIARVGDKAVCRKHGNTVIATGDPTCMIDGKPAARHGDKTACGAVLIASQAPTTD